MWCPGIVWCMDRFHEIHFMEWEAAWWIFMVWERLTRKQTTSRPDNVWPDMWRHMSDASKRKEKQKWAVEKPKLDNARRLRGIYFIDPGDEEFKDIMKNARGKLEIPMPAAMPCKTSLCRSSRKTCRAIGGHKTKIHLYCWSWRIYENPNGWKSSQISWRSHCRKRDEFIKSLQSSAQIYSFASSNENTRYKGSSGQ